MGSGIWDTRAFNVYTCATKGVNMDTFRASDASAQEIYKSRSLSPMLDPKNVMRECRDSTEHPETVPVILALDVTGSMGGAAAKVAKQLNDIMTSLYDNPNVNDIEFCIMAIGDLKYDSAPIQMSQFESDIRIAEQLDAVYFERGGGGNNYESYTAAWYMGLYHTDLDCWKRGKKGIIITMGDELPNPYLPANSFKHGLNVVTGDNRQGDVETDELFKDVTKKFDVYHISVDDSETSYNFYKHCHDIDNKWRELIGDNYHVSNLNDLNKTITEIIIDHEEGTELVTSTSDEIGW